MEESDAKFYLRISGGDAGMVYNYLWMVKMTLHDNFTGKADVENYSKPIEYTCTRYTSFQTLAKFEISPKRYQDIEKREFHVRSTLTFDSSVVARIDK